MKKLLLIPFLVIPLFLSNGCKDGVNCEGVAMWCDIASTMIGSIYQNDVIPVATNFIVTGVITNLKYQGKCKEPANPPTAETHTGYEVQFYTGNKSISDDGWETIGFTDENGNTTELLSIYTESLIVGQDKNISNTYKFETAGKYRFIQTADRLDEEQEERDENNNGITSDDTELEEGGKNFKNSVFIVQVTDPENKGKVLKKGELPTVKYLGTKVTYTFTDNNEL